MRRELAASPRWELLLGLINRLPYEPASRYRAEELLGGGEFFGYSYDSARLNDLIDMLDLNTRAGAQRKAKLKPIAQRPDVRQPKKTSFSVQDMLDPGVVHQFAAIFGG